MSREKKVVVLDYGLCNLFSIRNALTHVGATVVMADGPKTMADADRLVLPGVGAFQDGMAGLKERGLIEPVLEHVEKGRPMLGICLGMQMLADSSEEFGMTQGLGIIPGKNLAIPGTKDDRVRVKIPHIGWTPIHPATESATWDNNILEGIEPGTSFYFVHSFTVFPENEFHRVADANYYGRRVSAVIGKDNVFGTQFHPEKSGWHGLRILTNFLAL